MLYYRYLNGIKSYNKTMCISHCFKDTDHNAIPVAMYDYIDGFFTIETDFQFKSLILMLIVEV